MRTGVPAHRSYPRSGGAALDAESVKRRLPDWLRPGGDLVVDTTLDAIDDRVPGLAAEVAFYLILSLPPLLLTVLTSAALVGRRVLGDVTFESRTTEAVHDVVGAFLSPRATDDLVSVTDTALARADGALLSIGFLLTLFTASRALRVLTVAITIAYDLEDQRPAWQQFLYGLGLTAAGLLLGMIVVPVFVAGPDAGRALTDLAVVPAGVADLYRVLYWPISALLATALLAVLYHVAAPWWTPWRRDLPGALLGMVVGLGGSFGLRLYTQRTISSQELFSPFATTLVILLWLYVVAFGILLGAELNAEIEKRWPTARGPLGLDPHPDAGDEARSPATRHR